MSSRSALRRAGVRRRFLFVRPSVVPPLNSVTVFAMLTLAAWGSYLLGVSFANPMASDITPVIIGAVMISTSGVLFVCLARRRPLCASPLPESLEALSPRKRPAIELPARGGAAWPLASVDLAFHRIYVDHVWIRR